jgi:tetratricopeptide (TPR) repeat protein
MEATQVTRANSSGNGGDKPKEGRGMRSLQRKGTISLFVVIASFFALVCANPLLGADKKVKGQTEGVRSAQPSAPSPANVNDVNVDDHFKAGEDLLKKGKQDQALRLFLGVYDYSRDILTLLKCVKAGYEKALAGSGIDQEQKEELLLKVQRIASLNSRYTGFKGEAAYRIGVVYRAKGNSEQARKYLLETCQTSPFSLDPASTWMKAKEMLLSLSNLEGEF